MSIKNLFTRADGRLSEGRITSVATFFMWVAITVYLVLNKQTWGHYEGFSAICLGYGVRQYFNKRTEVTSGLGKPKYSSNPGVTKKAESV